MSEVMIPVKGGGGTSSDELTASKAQVLEGYTAITKNSDDEPVYGTLPNLTQRSNIQYASDNATKVIPGDAIFQSTNTDNVNRICVRYNDSPGYITDNTLFGFPSKDFGDASSSDVASNKTFTSFTGIKVRGTLADRGQYQNGTPVWCDTYFAINGLPEGIYRSNGASWAPEARCTAEQLRNALGINGGKIIPGNTIAGVSSTVSSQGGQTITPTASQQTVWCSGKYMTGNIVINAANIAKKANGSSTISSDKKSFYNSTLSKTESHSYFTVNFSGFNTIMLFAWINGYCAGISYGDTNFNFVTKYTGGGYYTGGATLTNTTAIFPVDTGYGDTTVWWSVAGY